MVLVLKRKKLFKKLNFGKEEVGGRVQISSEMNSEICDYLSLVILARVSFGWFQIMRLERPKLGSKSANFSFIVAAKNLSFSLCNPMLH